MEQGLELASEELSSVRSWKERLDLASRQMAEVLEMLQADATVFRCG